MKSLMLKVASVLMVLMLLFAGAIAEEIVLADNQDIVVKIKGFGEDSLWGHTMKLYVENKTDKLLMFSIDECAVNGVMNDPFWAKEVMAGSKANAEISWSEIHGASEITKLDLKIRVYDSEDWMADAFLDQSFEVFPKGKENAVLAEREGAAEDIVLFDNEYASMLISGFKDDEIWGYTANVYLKNKTDKPLMFSVENAMVNGFMCDPFWAKEVMAGTAAYSSISWMEDDFELNEITEVEEIVLGVKVYDSDDWMAEPVVEKQYTVQP